MNITKTVATASMLVVFLFTSSTQAAIMLVDSESFSAGDVTVGSRTITSAELNGFDANGVSKLVVSIGGEGDSNGASNNTVTSVTYGGASMNLAVAANSGNRRSSIWYLDDVSVTGDFEISFVQDQDGIGFGAYALNGTLPGVADTNDSGGGTTLPIETTMPGEFVVAALARNNFDELQGPGTTGPPGPTVGTQPPLTELFYANLSGSSAASAYATLGAPGTYDLTIFENNSSGRIVAAAFQPVPEPATVALFAVAGLIYLAQRRR